MRAAFGEPISNDRGAIGGLFFDRQQAARAQRAKHEQQNPRGVAAGSHVGSL
jgi:hypothetical protein